MAEPSFLRKWLTARTASLRSWASCASGASSLRTSPLELALPVTYALTGSHDHQPAVGKMIKQLVDSCQLAVEDEAGRRVAGSGRG